METPARAITRHLARRIAEKRGYGNPFKMFTWSEWEEMHIQTQRCFARFQRAIQEGRIDTALLIALEMDEMIDVWLAEVCAQMKR